MTLLVAHGKRNELNNIGSECCAGDVRNDIYITLMQGELRRGAGGKVADKNIEVTIVVCNKAGDVIPVSITINMCVAYAYDPLVT